MAQVIACSRNHDDKFIQPEGLPNFVMIPPSPLDLSSGPAVMGNDVATETEENET